LLGKSRFDAYVSAMSKKRTSKGPALTHRTLRVAELIRRTLSEVLQRGELHDPDLGRMMITVGEVRCTSDLRYATCYVLPLGGKNQDEALAALRRNTNELRYLVTQAIDVKHSPELRFEIDRTFEQIDHTNRLLSDENVKRDLDE